MKAKILLAVEEVELGSRLELLLSAQGYLACVAPTRVSLFHQLAYGGDGVALVLFDAKSLSDNSLEVLREIRALSQGLPILALVDREVQESARNATALGVAGFLSRTATAEAIAGAIQSILETAGGSRQRFLCRNSRMQEIRQILTKVSGSDVPVVFQGESGTGKEVLARELHHGSPRAGHPFVKLNCAALPSELLESELFGYERGAFTGAFKSTPGKFEIAGGGSLLLDEIGDMDLKLQAKLLHVLQDWEYYRLGGKKPIRVNVRVLAATHRNLEEAVRDGRFREDLYYRLNVINIEIPPLRRRRDEILPLMRFFLQKHAAAGHSHSEISPALAEEVMAYDWPGNVRELENISRKLLVFGAPDVVAEELRSKRQGREFLKGKTAVSRSPLHEAQASGRRAEADAILAALHGTNWNRKKAAAMLNIAYKVLLYKMKKLGIDKPAAQEERLALENLPTGMIV